MVGIGMGCIYFLCVYGLVFIDVYNLCFEYILEDSNGNLWIVKVCEKINNFCNILFLSILK